MEPNSERKHSTPPPAGASPCLEAALGYLARGWSVIPVKDKHPLLKWVEFQDRKPTEAEVRGWYARWPDAAVGIVCGQVSGGLVVLDCDPRNGGDDSLDSLVAQGHLLPDSPIAATGGGGSHHYFTNPLPTIPAILAGVDLKGEGSYVVAPPSIHLSGGVYQWLSSPDMAEVAPAPEWLLALVRQHQEQRAAPQTNNSWVEELLAGVPQGRRDDAAIRLAGHFIGKGLAPSEVEAVLLAWNANNIPPWGDDPADKGAPAEWVRAKVTSVVKRERAGHPNGPAGKAPPEPYPAVPLAELVNGHLPPMPWVVEGLLPEANALIVGGFSTFGKSWLLLTMALAIAGGRPWLGRFQTVSGPVLYIDEENSEYELKRRLHRLKAGYGFDPKALQVHFIAGSGLRLSDSGGVLRLEETIKKYKPRAVMADTLIRILGYDENDASKVSEGFSKVKELMNRYGPAFVFADHHRKPQSFDAGPEMALRGSTDKQNFVDSILTLRRSRASGQLTALHTKARFGPSVPTFGYAVEDIGEGTVLTYQQVAEEEEKATLIDEAKDTLLGQFASADTVLTREEALLALESMVSARWGGEALRLLVAEGKLAKRGSRNRRKLYGLPVPQGEMEGAE